MKNNRSVSAGVAVLIGAVAVLSLVLPALHAQHSSAVGTTPPWEPDPNSAAPYGNLVFYDSSGNVVTGGSSLDHLFDFASGTTAADAGATKATLYFAAPNSANPTGAWAVVQASAPSSFTGKTFPGSVAAPGAAGDPVVSLAPTDGDLNAQLGGFKLDATPGYANIIQVRVKDSGPGVLVSSNYWSSDIAYNQGAAPIAVDGATVPPGGWAQVYPVVVTKTATATAITTTAPASVAAGTSVTYTAKVTPAPTDGGTVAFDDGAGNPATTSCSAQPVDGTGTATCQVSYAFNGTYTVNAVYQGSATFARSSSASPVSLTVTGGTTKGATSTTVTSDNPTSVVVGQRVTYTATVTSGAGTPSGTVTFNDGSGSAICSAVTLDNTGSASCPQTYSAAATHTVTAVYTNTDGHFAGSTSTAFSQVVKPAHTSVAVTSSQNPVSVGQTVTFTATVSVTAPGTGTPTGTVDFSDGAGNPASSCTGEVLSNGAATCSVTYTAAGSDQVSATYKNTDGNFAGATTSSPLAETVQAAGSLASAPGGVQAKAGNAQVVLSWTAPTGGGAVTGYNVFKGTSAGGEATKPANSTPITGTTDTVSGLVNGTTYYFTVEAVTAAGSSPASSEVSATPTASGATTTTSTPPSTAVPSGQNPGTGSADPGSTSQASPASGSTAQTGAGQGSTLSASQQSGTLPFTGARVTSMVGVGVLFLGSGVSLVGLTRKRKRLHTDR